LERREGGAIMSEPKRYGWEVNEENDFALVEHPQGQYVDYENYARLKAEVESIRKYWKATGEGVNMYVGKSIALEDEVARLKAENEKLKLTLEEERQISRQNWNYDPHYAYLQLNNARLKAEVERLTAFTTRTIIPNEELQAQVERLTKAGDAMVEHVLLAHWGSFEHLPIGWKKLIPKWFAAKDAAKDGKDAQ